DPRQDVADVEVTIRTFDGRGVSRAGGHPHPPRIPVDTFRGSAEIGPGDPSLFLRERVGPPSSVYPLQVLGPAFLGPGPRIVGCPEPASGRRVCDKPDHTVGVGRAE